MISRETTAGGLGTLGALGAGGGLSIIVSETVVPYVEEKKVRSETFATNLKNYFIENKDEKEIWKDVMEALKDGCFSTSREANIAVLKVKSKSSVDTDKSGKYDGKSKTAIKNGVENFYKSVNGRNSVEVASVDFVCKEVDRVLNSMETVIRVYG